jgi:hypothetical protein
MMAPDHREYKEIKLMFMQMKPSESRGSGMAVAGLMLVTSLFLFAESASAAPNSPPLTGAVAQATATPRPPTLEDDRRTIDGDQVVSGNNYTLRANDILRGDLTVFGGNAVLEEGSRVEGNVNIFGGEADVYGAVTGDINVVGGSLRLRPSARVEGGLHMLGGYIDRDPSAQVRGNTSRLTPPFVNRVESRSNSPFDVMFNLIGAAFAKIAGLVLITLLAIAVVTLFPNHTAVTADVVRHQWLVSGSIGILTFIAMPVVIGLLAITICLIPAAVIFALGWTVAILFGWVIAARVVGEQIAIQLHAKSWSVLGQTVMGVVILALLGMIPFIGWMIALLTSSVGLGALILCRGGTRNYPFTPTTPPTPPSLPSPAPTA